MKYSIYLFVYLKRDNKNNTVNHLRLRCYTSSLRKALLMLSKKNPEKIIYISIDQEER